MCNMTESFYWAWWYVFIVLVFGILRQKDQGFWGLQLYNKFLPTLGCMRPYFRQQQQQQYQQQEQKSMVPLRSMYLLKHI